MSIRILKVVAGGHLKSIEVKSALHRRLFLLSIIIILDPICYISHPDYEQQRFKFSPVHYELFFTTFVS